MKTHRLFLPLLICAEIGLLVVTAGAADPTKEFENSKEKYEAAAEVILRPVKERYLQELEQQKNRAIALKDLTLAMAIEKEIAAIAPAPRSSAVKTGTDLQRYLGDTSWSWGKTENTPGSTLTFRRDGTCSVNSDAPVRWAATDDSTVKLENGTVIKFNGNHKSYTATTNSGPRAGKKL